MPHFPDLFRTPQDSAHAHCQIRFRTKASQNVYDKKDSPQAGEEVLYTPSVALNHVSQPAVTSLSFKRTIDYYYTIAIIEHLMQHAQCNHVVERKKQCKFLVPFPNAPIFGCCVLYMLIAQAHAHVHAPPKRTHGEYLLCNQIKSALLKIITDLPISHLLFCDSHQC
jgi:hypothetical protein